MLVNIGAVIEVGVMLDDELSILSYLKVELDKVCARVVCVGVAADRVLWVDYIGSTVRN